MKLTKKILAVVLAVALVAVLGVAAFAAGPSLSLSATKSGKTVTLTLSGSNLTGFQAGDVVITYDNTKLTYVDRSITTPEGIGDGGKATDADNQVTFSYMTTDAMKTSSAVLATYTFKVVDGADGTADFSMSIGSFSVNDAEVTPSTSGTSVDLTEKETTTKENSTKENPTKVGPTEPTSSTPVEPTSRTNGNGKKGIAQTGEASIAVIAGVMAVAAAAFVATRKKNEE